MRAAPPMSRQCRPPPTPRQDTTTGAHAALHLLCYSSGLLWHVSYSFSPVRHARRSVTLIRRQYLLRGEILRHGGDLVLGEVLCEAMHDLAFPQLATVWPTVELLQLDRKIVPMLASQPWECVDSLGVRTVAANAPENVTLRHPVLVNGLAFRGQGWVLRCPDAHARLAREVLSKGFDLIIVKRPGYPPHKGTCMGIGAGTLPE